MGREDFRALIWRLHHFTRRLNWAAATGVALLAFEAGFYFSTVAPALEKRTMLRAQVIAQRPPANRASQPARADTDPRVDLAKFYAALEQSSRAPDLLRRLHANAEHQGLQVQQAQYRPVPDPEGRVLRYQILMPAKGTYPEIRKFLDQASRELPGLAIDGVNFQRQQIDDTRVEAQIKLTLFLSSPS